MSDETPDIGETLHCQLTDGRTLELRPTFGDLARFEDETGRPASACFEAGLMTSTSARMAFYAASRTCQFAGSWEEWRDLLGLCTSITDTAAPVEAG